MMRIATNVVEFHVFFVVKLSQTLSCNSDVEDLSMLWSVDDTGDESQVDSQSDPIEDLYMECKVCHFQF